MIDITDEFNTIVDKVHYNFDKYGLSPVLDIVLDDYKSNMSNILILAWDIVMLKNYRDNRMISSRDQYLNRQAILLEELDEYETAKKEDNTIECIDALTDMIVVNLNAIDGIYSDHEIGLAMTLSKLLEFTLYVNPTSSFNLNQMIKNYINSADREKTLKYNIWVIVICFEYIRRIGYNPYGVLLETVKHISSREQDPIQKKEWAEGKKTGKWLKDKNQDPSTIYQPDFDKWMI